MITYSDIEIQKDWTLIQDKTGFANIKIGEAYYAFTEKDSNGNNQVPADGVTGDISNAYGNAINKIDVPDNTTLYMRLKNIGTHALVTPNY